MSDLLNKVERTIRKIEKIEKLQSEASEPPRIIIKWCACEGACTCTDGVDERDTLIRFVWEQGQDHLTRVERGGENG